MAVHTATISGTDAQNAYYDAGTPVISSAGSFVRFGETANFHDYRFGFLIKNVQVAQGRIIQSAPLVLKYTGQSTNQPDNPTLLLSAEDVASGVKAATGAAFFAKTRVAETDFGKMPYVSSGAPITCDVAPLIQAIVNRSDWQSGNDIFIIARAANLANVNYYNFGSTSSSYPPSLTITHTAAITGQITAQRRRRAALITGTQTAPVVSGTITATRPRRSASLQGELLKQYLVLGELTAQRPRRAAQIEAQQTQPVTSGEIATQRPHRTAQIIGTVETYLYTGSITATRPRRSASITGGIPVRFGGQITAYRPRRKAKLEGFVTPDLVRRSKPIVTQHIRLLNRSREVLAVLDVSNPPVWSRKRNEATEISVEVPRGDIKLPYTQIASLLEVWKGERRLIGGRISGRDVGSELVTIRAMSEEILLEQHVCPVNYGGLFSNLDLADVARRCLDGWHTLRVNRDWTARQVASSQVDLATSPGYVMIERRNGAYLRKASITQRFLKSEVPRFKDWERVRWSSDFDPPVFTTLEYRYQTNGVWSAWKPDRQVSVGTTTGRGERGILPDSYGLYVTAGTADILEVRCNLYTDDIESQEEDTQETKGTTPIWFALEVVARVFGHVYEGEIPASAGVTVKSVEASNSSALAILRAACEQVGHEFRVESGALSIAKEFGRSRVDDFLLVG